MSFRWGKIRRMVPFIPSYMDVQVCFWVYFMNDDISLKGDDDNDNVWLYSNLEGDGRGSSRGREGGKAKPSCH